jgi:hypothetical protein
MIQAIPVPGSEWLARTVLAESVITGPHLRPQVVQKAMSIMWNSWVDVA